MNKFIFIVLFSSFNLFSSTIIYTSSYIDVLSGKVISNSSITIDDNKIISSTTEYSKIIVTSVEQENIFGTQFHPEKSDKIGLKIIDNFINL